MGFVEETGGGPLIDLRGNHVQRGDRLVWSVARSCHTCRACRRGFPQKCVTVSKYGHHGWEDDWQLSGGLASYCHLLPGTSTVIVGRELPDAVLCPASCATATAAAALRQAGSLTGERVLVLGSGLLGITAAVMANDRKAATVTVCDATDERLEIARTFRPNRIIHWQDFRKRIADGSYENEAAFDVVLEMSGDPTAVEAGLAVAAIGGRVVCVGSVMPTRTIAIDPEQIVRRLLTLVGVHNYTPADLVAAVDFLERRGQQYPFADAISQTFRLDQVEAAFQFALSHRPLRVAVRPEAERVDG